MLGMTVLNAVVESRYFSITFTKGPIYKALFLYEKYRFHKTFQLESKKKNTSHFKNLTNVNFKIYFDNTRIILI